MNDDEYIAGCVAEGRILVWIDITQGSFYQTSVHESMFPFAPEDAMKEKPTRGDITYPGDIVTFWLIEVDTRDVIAVFDWEGLITTDLSCTAPITDKVQP